MAIDPRDKAMYEQHQINALAEAAKTEGVPIDAYSYERCGLKPTPIDARLATQGADARPVAMDAHSFALMCDALPADFSWGDPLTPDVFRHIESVLATRDAAPRDDAIYEAMIQHCEVMGYPIEPEVLDELANVAASAPKEKT